MYEYWSAFVTIPPSGNFNYWFYYEWVTEIGSDFYIGIYEKVGNVKRNIWKLLHYFDPATIYLSVCTMSGKWAVKYMCVRDIDFPSSFYDVSIGF
jgi:hypothetical protein